MTVCCLPFKLKREQQFNNSGKEILTITLHLILLLFVPFFIFPLSRAETELPISGLASSHLH